MSQILRAAQVAEKLNIAKSTVHKMVSESRLPHIRLGKRFIRFRNEEIVKFLESKSVTTSNTEEEKNAN